jgi:large subunit ribosomal protein L29
MKPLNSNELREMSVEKLEELNQERRRQAFDLRFQHYTGKLQDSASMRVNRRDIARIETILRERALTAGEG